jgi:hypothetical protein
MVLESQLSAMVPRDVFICDLFRVYSSLGDFVDILSDNLIVVICPCAVEHAIHRCLL